MPDKTMSLYVCNLSTYLVSTPHVHTASQSIVLTGPLQSSPIANGYADYRCTLCILERLHNSPHSLVYSLVDVVVSMCLAQSESLSMKNICHNIFCTHIVSIYTAGDSHIS